MLSVMASNYGARFADMWAGINPDELKREWIRKLSPLKPEEIVRGIDSLTRFCPTLPEFIELCRPRPDYETAYREAVVQTRLRRDRADTWSNPAIYWASLRISYFDLMQCSYAQVKARWTSALDECINNPNIMPVPAAQTSLPPVGGTHTPEVAQASIAKMKNMQAAIKSSRLATGEAHGKPLE